MWGRDVSKTDVIATTLAMTAGYMLTQSFLGTVAVTIIYGVGYFLGLENQARADIWYSKPFEEKYDKKQRNIW